VIVEAHNAYLGNSLSTRHADYARRMIQDAARPLRILLDQWRRHSSAARWPPMNAKD